MPTLKRAGKTPSYRDIADQAGVSLMTVSLALRNSPRISKPTRTRVRRVAAELGYTSDPKIADMMNYLRRRRVVKHHPVLALINARGEPLSRLHAPYTVGIARAASAAAQRQGYHTEEFWLGASGMTERRLSDILEARGIRGVLLLPLPPGRAALNLNWSRFAAISTCYLSHPSGLHHISTHRQHYIELAMKELRVLGYRRIGLAIDEDMDVRSHHQTLAHYLWDQSRLPESQRVRALLAPTLEREPLRDWLDEQKPEVVVSPRNHVHTLLVQLGYKIPRRIAFVSLAASARDVPNLSGVDERPETVGKAAADFLAAQLQRGEFGVPQVRQFLLVEAGWIQGKTVRRVSSVF
jgi:DNA-binding LacI/PurR family transcriptional regulator